VYKVNIASVIIEIPSGLQTLSKFLLEHSM